MEVTAAGSTTGSKTIADLIPCTAAENGDKIAVATSATEPGTR